MPTVVTSHASTQWEGSLTEGKGTVQMQSSGIGSFAVSWPSRSESHSGQTSPEELIAAAHSTCYSMALAHALGQAGTPPQHLHTQAEVGFQAGTGITGITLSVTASVPGIDADQFEQIAEQAKNNCPVSQALAGTTITLHATLL